MRERAQSLPWVPKVMQKAMIAIGEMDGWKFVEDRLRSLKDELKLVKDGLRFVEDGRKW